jgi:hypothetical protein
LHTERDFWQIIGLGILKKEFEWVGPLRDSVSSVVVIGCWDQGDTSGTCSEPYALLRILEACNAVVVDKEAEYIRNAQGWLERTQARYPDLFNDCNVEFVVSDIAEGMGQLASEGFDLAYCSNVLYYMKSDIRRLQAAVNTIDIIGNKRLSRCAAGGSKVVQATRHHHHRVIKLRFRVAEHIFNNPTPFDPCNHMFDHNAHT